MVLQVVKKKNGPSFEVLDPLTRENFLKFWRKKPRYLGMTFGADRSNDQAEVLGRPPAIEVTGKIGVSAWIAYKRG
jgi:hypothetical protein